jgi:hypothetical protein
MTYIIMVNVLELYLISHPFSPTSVFVVKIKVDRPFVILNTAKFQNIWPSPRQTQVIEGKLNQNMTEGKTDGQG